MALDVIARAAPTDPGWEPSDTPQVVLDHHFGAQGLNNGRDTVAIAFVDGAPVGVVLAQAGPGLPYGRLTYVAVAAGVQGGGVGGWVHRHGVQMLRAQGASRYRGGTTSTNLAMRRLFERMGCAFVGELVELRREAG